MSEGEDELKSYVSDVAAFGGAHLPGLAQEVVEERLKALAHSAVILYAMGLSAGTPFYRGRFCDDANGWPSVRNCIYPDTPEAVQAFGRANYPKQPVFYGSTTLPTVLSELQPITGQYVQLVAVRCIAPFKVHVVGDVARAFHTRQLQIPADPAALLHHLDQVDPLQRLKQVYFDSFIADLFSRKNKRDKEHRITAAYAKQLFDYDFDGILYPSVETRGGMNIAMPAKKFDRAFEVLGSAVYRVDTILGYSLFLATPCRVARAFERDNFVWDEGAYSIDRDPVANPNVWGAAPGWRAPQST
jgi:hypothetical protein